MSHIKTLIGAPTAATERLFQAIEHIAKASGFGRVHRLDRTDLMLPAQSARPTLYLTTYPSEEMIAAIHAEATQAILLDLNPATTVSWYIAERNCSLAESVRAHTATFVANLAIGTSGTARTLGFYEEMPVAEAIAAILYAFGFFVPSADLPVTLGSLGPGGDPTASIAEIEVEKIDQTNPIRHNTLGLESLEIIDNILSPLMRMARTGKTEAIRWPAGICLSGDRIGEHASDTEAVTGPARTIIYGPYMHLPPAIYDAAIHLGFHGAISDISFYLELLNSSLLARVLIGPRPEGEYRGRFTFQVDDPIEPIELRLRNDRGSIEGEISFLGLELTPRIHSAFS